MAEIAGKVGAIYWRPVATGTTFAFVDSNPDTITDSDNGFVTAGFADGDLITVSGSTSNNGTFTVDTVAAGTLTLAAGASLTAEGAGDDVTIIHALPGQVLAQFYNWSFANTCDILDVTNFQDDGKHTYIAGLKHWTATIEKHWSTTDNQNAWIGAEKLIRFFTRYDASPDVTNAYYYEGTANISGLSVTTPNDGVITQTITIEGDGVLTFTTRSTAWPVAD